MKGLRNASIVSFIVSMAILLVGGRYANKQVPPIPDKVTSASTVLTDRAAIMRGQDVYQRYGLMDHGSVWGHGSLRGMDFSAFTLHCIGELMRQHHISSGKPAPEAYASLPPAPRPIPDELDATVTKELRVNRYDAQSGALELTAAQAYAFDQMRRYWDNTFAEGDHHGTRESFLP